MSWVIDGIKALVRWMIFLALTGGMIQSTGEIYEKSNKTIRRGLISLTDLNNQLVNAKARNVHNKNLSK